MNKFVITAVVSVISILGWASADSVKEACESEIQSVMSMAIEIDDEFTPDCAKQLREEYMPENWDMDTVFALIEEMESKRDDKEMRDCRHETRHSYDHMPKDRREEIIKQVKEMEISEPCETKLREVYDMMKNEILGA